VRAAPWARRAAWASQRHADAVFPRPAALHDSAQNDASRSKTGQSRWGRAFVAHMLYLKEGSLVQTLCPDKNSHYTRGQAREAAYARQPCCSWPQGLPFLVCALL
jgi:hypothetical protein